MRITIVGAGSIGMMVGGVWQAHGAQVDFVGRKNVGDEIARYGLRLTSVEGWHHSFAPGAMSFHTTLADVPSPDLVVLAAKATALENTLAQIRTQISPGTAILTLQNGIGAGDAVRAALPGNPVIEGLVSHNVARLGEGLWFKSTSGDIWCEDHTAIAELATLSQESIEPLRPTGNFRDRQWGKLLVNLNNAVNAVSGLGLRDQLLTRKWRTMTADAISEGLAACRAAGIRPARAIAMPTQWLPAFLRMPDPLFRHIGLRIQRVDPKARTSMADDVRNGRVTEIDVLNGAIVALGREHGVPTPVNAWLIEQVRQLHP